MTRRHAPRSLRSLQHKSAASSCRTCGVFGSTTFVDVDTPRWGEQAALGADLLALLDSPAIPHAVPAGYDWGHGGVRDGSVVARALRGLCDRTATNPGSPNNALWALEKLAIKSIASFFVLGMVSTPSELLVAVPALGYVLLKRVVNAFNAAAVAATYGSVSAVTFITAVQLLDSRGLPYGGHMAAAMALMELPAIVMAVVLANRVRQGVPAASGIAVGAVLAMSAGGATQRTSIGRTLHEALTDGAQLLLLGAMVVGVLTGEAGRVAMQPFAGDLFKGMLAFFLLDMGLLAARNMGGLKGQSPWLLAYAVAAPLLHAALALGICTALGISPGNGALLMVLAASASYIAVPAVLRHAIPEAQPAIYFGMSLGLTFPLNILIGIPLYIDMAHRVLT